MDSALLDTAVVHGLFWVIALAAAIWILGPSVMIALGKRRLEVEIREDPTAAEPRGDDPDYEGYYRRIYALGYRPVGATVETGKFFSPIHWRYRSEGSRVMVSQDGKTFMSFDPDGHNRKLRFNATTIFEGGGALKTVYTSAKQNVSPGGNYKCVLLIRTDPVALLEEHQDAVADFCERRGLVARRATLREIADEDVKLTLRLVPRHVTLPMFSLVAAMYLMPAVPFLMLLKKRPDFAPWWIHTAVGLCFVSLLFAMVRWMVLPSRVPWLIRTLSLAALMFLPLVSIPYQETYEKTSNRISAALDRLESDVDQGLPVDPAIDQVVAVGAKACRQTMRRMDAPATSAARKQAFHRTLIRLHGSDLGDTYRAWLPWCREAYRRP